MRHFRWTLTSPQTPNWASLSPEAQETLRTIALPISLGYSQAEVAAALGKTQPIVCARLADLRVELGADA
jgi:hypothetical protein